MNEDCLCERVPARKAWLLGVCGMGVGPLAIYMREEGWDVSGWDDAKDSPMLPFLQRAGVQFSQNLEPDVELIARSSAVKPGNPLYEEATRNAQRLLRRGELLAERAAEKKLIAVCGSHGKTTTSGILVQTLLAANCQASYVLGGLYKDANLPPAHFTKESDWLVAEVDESDGTIQHFSPEICVVVNLDWDHPDYYKTEAALEATFRALFERTKRAIFIPAGSERLRRLTQGLSVPVFTVGASADYIYRVVAASNSETQLELAGKFSNGILDLPIAGTFNTQNALLALAVTNFVCNGRLGASPLGKFTGMRRRQDVLFSGKKIKVVADYAHHPTEISALLRFLRETHLGKLFVVFQPHRYSRTRQYASEFANALTLADEAFVVPVYSAGEAKIAGGEAVDILAALSAGTRKLRLCGNEEEVLENLRIKLDEILNENESSCLFAFVGAGDIDRKFAAPFVRELWLHSELKQEGESENFGTRMRSLLSKKTKFEADKPLGAMTTLGAGGNAKWYAEPANINELLLLLRGARVAHLPIFVLGRGSNILVRDSGFQGLVIRLIGDEWSRLQCVAFPAGTCLEENSPEYYRDCIRAGAGAKLKELCAFAAKEGLSGFEFLEGIPGTIGGALRMNAGAFGASIFDRIVSVEWMMPDGSHHELARESLSPTYRDCPELHGAIILSAVLRANGKKLPDDIARTMRDFSEIRHANQPRERSAGCSFKNPPGDSAGRIIDTLGLKELTEGGAKVSPIHANFIVSNGNASASEIELLLRKVRGIVKAETGIILQPEIILVGGEWGEI